MENKKFLLVILLIVANSLTFFYAQSLTAQWTLVNSSSSVTEWEAVAFTNSNSGYAAGYIYSPQIHPRMKKTTNAGLNWTAVTNFPAGDTADGVIFRTVYFTDLNTGYVGGGNPNNVVIQGMILKTTDGGNSWFDLTLPINNLINYVYFINSNTGFASGWSVILKTTNAGVNWAYQPLLPNHKFQIDFTDENTGYVVGNQGYIHKTTDGGNNWISQTSGITTDLWGIGFANASTGIAVGGSPLIILRTTDGGSKWSNAYESTTGCTPWRVRFISPFNAFVPGYCAQLFKTQTAGASWCSYQFLLSFTARDITFTSADTGYLVGNNGYIFKTTNGGGNCTTVNVEHVSNEIPSQYLLDQNYPNPFNPSTKISFALPENADVKIVVFDVLGREVSTLVNEYLNAGSYEVDWDASGNSAGVYYYQLSAGDLKITKKMILTK